MTDEPENRPGPTSRFAPMALGAVLVLGLIAWLVIGERANSPGPSNPSTGNGEEVAATDPKIGALDREGPGRREAVTDPESERAPRGFRGIVARPDGTPAPGATVKLFERSPFDPALAALRRSQGEAWPAFAQATTDDQGRFEIGIRSRDVRSFQLLAAHPEHAATRAEADLQDASEFVEIGEIRLAAAARLRGRVTVANTPLPIADATVTIHRTALIRGAPPAPLPVPTSQTSADGRFAFQNIAPGHVTVVVRAADYAQAFRTQVEVRLDSAPEVLLEMEAGRAITGEIVDNVGLPIRGALVTSIHADTGITESVRSDDRGRFALRNLRSGRHGLTAKHSGYEEAKAESVLADAENLRLRCTKLPSLDVRVTRPDGGLQSNFDLVARGYYESSPNDFARLPDSALRTVSAADLDARGVITLPGLQAGNYVLEVRADGFARTFSDPFRSPDDMGGRILEIRLDRGAAVRGSVRDAVGRPLTNAEVELTGISGDDGPLGSMLGQLSVSRATRTVVRTGADGLFLAGGLTPGPYRVLVRHEDHAEWALDEPITVLDGDNQGLPPIRLTRGTVLEGTVSFAGEPASRARVRILREPTRPGMAPELVCEATTDASGKFTVAERLPAGNFTATAERELDSPLRVLIDQKRTLTRFTLDGRRDRFRLELDDSR